MKTYSFENGYGTTYTFEIVDKIPKGYKIWNIDFNNMAGSLIPLCKCYEGTYNVIPDQLKAIAVEDGWARGVLRIYASRGTDTPAKIKKNALELLKALSE